MELGLLSNLHKSDAVAILSATHALHLRPWPRYLVATAAVSVKDFFINGLEGERGKMLVCTQNTVCRLGNKYQKSEIPSNILNGSGITMMDQRKYKVVLF